MGRKLALLVTLILIVQVSQASAQRGRQPAPSGWALQEPAHKLEITPFGGYVWTVSERVWTNEIPQRSGDLDFKSNGFWGFLVDVNVRPGMQVEMLYQRLDTDLTFKEGGITEKIGDIAVEYWQIGVLQGVQNDKVMPFGLITLGASHFIFDQPGVENMWKFAMILGLGAKYYVNEKIALRVQGRMPFTFLGGGVGIGVGTGGGYVGVSGYGIAQFDVSIGLSILI